MEGPGDGSSYQVSRADCIRFQSLSDSIMHLTGTCCAVSVAVELFLLLSWNKVLLK